MSMGGTFIFPFLFCFTILSYPSQMSISHVTHWLTIVPTPQLPTPLLSHWILWTKNLLWLSQVAKENTDNILCTLRSTCRWITCYISQSESGCTHLPEARRTASCKRERETEMKADRLSQLCNLEEWNIPGSASLGAGSIAQRLDSRDPMSNFISSAHRPGSRKIPVLWGSLKCTGPFSTPASQVSFMRATR